MDFHFPQKIRLGQGASQHVGLAAKESGARVLLMAEAVYEGSKELAILTQSLDRAVVPYMLHFRKENLPPKAYLDEAVSLVEASHCEALVSLGSHILLSFARWVALEAARVQTEKTGQPQEFPLIEVPTTSCFPLLLRDEGFLSLGHPSELNFFPAPLSEKHRIYLDPHMVTNLTPKSSVTALMETLFFAVEAYFHSGSGLLEQSLLLGAIEALWKNMRNILENPANVEYRLTTYQAGFNIALALAVLPRSPGFSLSFVLSAVVNLPPAALGSLFLAPFLEVYGPKGGERLRKLSQALAVGETEDTLETIGARLAQEIRKFLNINKLPLRLSDYRVVETQLILAADVVKAMNLPRGSLLESEELPEFLKTVV